MRIYENFMKLLKQINKKIFIAILIAIFAISPLRIDLLSFSQNFAKGEMQPLEDLYISENTTWNSSTDLSIYENIYVDLGATLTIEKGTQLAFRHLIIDGNVIAQGTKEEKIKLTGIVPTFEESGIYDPHCFMSASANIEFYGLGDYADDPESVFEFVEFSQMGGYYNYDTDNCPGLGMNNNSIKNWLFPVAYASPVEVFAPAINFYSGRVKMNNCDFENNAYTDVKVEMEYDSEWNAESYLQIENSNFENNSQNTALISKVTKPEVYSELFENCFDECKSNYPNDYSIYGPICTNYCKNIAENDPSFHDKTKVILKNNWYNDPAGPEIETIPNVGGEKIIGDYTLESWSATKIPNTAEGGASSVLFLPGLEASRLYDEDNQLWEPNRNADVEKLFLDEDGKSLNEDIYTKDVLDEANVSPILQKNIYKSFLSDLDKWKNDEKIIADYSAVPYDWRLSLEDILDSGVVDDEKISYIGKSATPYIIKELRRLASTSKSGKVTIVAHSNGGLLAKALTNKLDAEAQNLIDKIVFVGVPQVGTPQAIGGLLHGFDQGLPTDWLSFFVSPKNARILGKNMSSAYNLLPSEAYFSGDGSAVSTPVISFEDGSLTDLFINKYGHEIDESDELHNFLLDEEGKVSADSDDLASPSKINSDLLEYGENTHQALDDNWTASSNISVYQIAGFGEETLGTVKYWTGVECVKFFQGFCLETQPKLQYSPEMVIDGDGTVVSPSALAMKTDTENVKRYWVDLKKYDTFYNLKREHADILEVEQLRDFIKDNILTQSETALPNYLSDSKPSITSEKRLQYILHSPLALSAHDTVGNEISATNSTIPNAEYKRFGEVQYISLPASTIHTVKLDGLAEGSFTLEMQEVENSETIAKTTFAGIPTSAGTKVEMEVTDGTIGNALPLEVDFDGDDTIDFSLKPKVGETVFPPALDQTPPEARMFFDTETKTVAVEGIDENPTTVTYSMTSTKHKKQKDKITTATITDQAENTTVLIYREKFSNFKWIPQVEIISLSYNGALTNLKNTKLKYIWIFDKKKEKYRMFATNLRTSSDAVESHYRSKQDITIIMSKPQELDDSDDDSSADKRLIREKLSGLVIPEFVTNQGVVSIKY